MRKRYLRCSTREEGLDLAVHAEACRLPCLPDSSWSKYQIAAGVETACPGIPAGCRSLPTPAGQTQRVLRSFSFSSHESRFVEEQVEPGQAAVDVRAP